MCLVMFFLDVANYLLYLLISLTYVTFETIYLVLWKKTKKVKKKNFLGHFSVGNKDCSERSLYPT